MAAVTIISDQLHEVEAHRDGDTILLDPDKLTDAIGWELKAQGLCQGDVCVPVRDPGALRRGDRLDLAAVAEALGRQVVIDSGIGIAALGAAPDERRQALADLHAAPFALNDLDGKAHHLDEWRGTKKLLVAFSSW
jgi:hypothetical protein